MGPNRLTAPDPVCNRATKTAAFKLSLSMYTFLHTRSTFAQTVKLSVTGKAVRLKDVTMHRLLSAKLQRIIQEQCLPATLLTC